jgi:hypothetical protein
VIGASLAAAGAIGRVRYEVVPAGADELLWAADLVSWAYGVGGTTRGLIAGLVTVHDLP